MMVEAHIWLVVVCVRNIVQEIDQADCIIFQNRSDVNTAVSSWRRPKTEALVVISKRLSPRAAKNKHRFLHSEYKI
jgi:hypothetical protein